MGHNQGTTPPHPKNHEFHSNSEVAKEALKSLKTQTEALNNLCTYLLAICALISLKDGLFSEFHPSFTYYYSETIAATTLTFISILIRKQHIQRKIDIGIKQNIKSLFPNKDISNSPSSKSHKNPILSIQGKYMYKKGRIKPLTDKHGLTTPIKQLATLIEHYGTQATLLTSFISIMIAGSNYSTLKLASGIILIAVPLLYCIAVCTLITKSNRRLVNYILRQSKG